jgi:hypothetical protein
LLILALALTVMACNDDVLKQEEMPVYSLGGPLVLSNKYPVSSITLNIPDAENKAFSVTAQPKWLELDPLQGAFRDGITTMQYRFIDPGYQTSEGYYTAPLVLEVEGTAHFYLEVWYGDFENNPDLPHSPGDNEVPVDEGNVVQLDGTVVDAAYHQNTDKLIIATKNPDRLLVFDTTTGSGTKTDLDKTPKCLEISPDGKVYVGHTVAFLSVFNLQNLELLETHALNCVPFDLAFGDNNWCYISPSGNDYESLRCLNMETGELIDKNTFVPSYHFYSNSYLIKVGDKPLLASTRTTVSPSGLLLFNISEGIPGDSIAYWHHDLRRFWISKDGQHMITSNGTAYFVPDYKIDYNSWISGFDLYGELELQLYATNHVYESEALNSFFVSETYSAYEGNYQYNNGIIQQFDRTSLSLKHNYTPSMKVIESNGSNVVAFHEVKYAFVNKAGSRLYAIRRIAADFEINQWSVEIFDVK